MVDKNEAANINVNDIVAEMEQATAPFIESRGKRPRSAPRLDTAVPVVEEPKKEEQPKEIEEEASAEETTQYSKDEQEALDMGWTPKDQYKGDPDDYVEAKEFVGRKSLYNKIKHQNDRIKNLEKATNILTDLNKRQYEMIHKDRQSYYQEQKKAAIAINSPEEVEKYEKLIREEDEEIKRYSEPEKTQEATIEHPPEVLDFVSRNKTWFNQDSDENTRMVRYATVFEEELARRRPEMSVGERMLETEREVKKTFSHRFENPARYKAASVTMAASENLSSKKSGKRKHSINDVPSSDRQAIQLMARQGKMSVEEYIEQLYETGYLKNE